MLKPSTRAVWTALMVMTVAAIASGCIQRDGTRFNPIDVIVGEVGEEDERETGRAIDEQIQHQLHLVHDPIVERFVNDLGLEIARGLSPQPFVYRFRIVKNPTLNAFATSGGYVYLHSELILRASTIDELAGVVGHEIAHIHKHHYARLRKRSQLPDLATQVLALGAALATGQPGLYLGVAGANVAMQLQYSRELEAEADETGSVYVARVGFDPSGSTNFFEKLLTERPDGFDSIPPYLYSHPALEERIEERKLASDDLEPVGEPEPSLVRRFSEAQVRLRSLLSTDRDEILPSPRLQRPSESYTRSGGAEPFPLIGNPRETFLIGERHLEAAEHERAMQAFWRTIELDPRRAAVFYNLGLAYKGLGDRPRAVHAFESAVRLAGSRRGIGARADWELAKQEGVIRESGFADGSPKAKGLPAGNAIDRFPRDTLRMAWWGRISPRFVDRADEIRVRWIQPDGTVARETAGQSESRVYLVSRIQAEDGMTVDPGTWTVEVIFDGDIVSRAEVGVAPGAEPALPPKRAGRRPH